MIGARMRRAASGLLVPDPPEPGPLFVGFSEPFFDSAYLLDVTGLTFGLNLPAKDGDNPIFPSGAHSHTWDDDKLFVAVVKRGGTFHMHYGGIKTGGGRVACYAFSSDGINWTRPNLGLYEYGGSTDNNIILEPPMAFSDAVYDDRLAKWVLLSERDSDGMDIYTADNPDGPFTLVKQWLFHGEGKGVVRRLDGLWVAYFRLAGEPPRRIRAYLSDSENLAGTWTDLGVILEPPGDENQYYHLTVHREGSVLYGLMTRYNATTEQMWLDLYTSEDGVDWTQRQTEWVPVGAGWESEFVIGGQKLAEDGDDWRVYYTGAPNGHDVSGGSRDSRVGRAVVGRQRIGQVGTTGEVTTVDLVVAAGCTLTVNVDAAGGSLEMEVQDDTGSPLTGFALADFDTITADEPAAVPLWGGTPMPDDRTLRLRFVLTDATLHHYELSDATAQPPDAEVPTGAYADEVNADSPVGWWPFEETSGSTVADVAGSNDGSVTGAELDVAGLVDGGSAIQFDGTNDDVTVGDTGLGTTYKTVEFLFKPAAEITKASSLQVPLIFRENYGIHFGGGFGTLSDELITINDSQTPANALVAWAPGGDVTLPAETTHVVFVWEDGTWKIWVNGIERIERATSGTPQQEALSQLLFAARDVDGDGTKSLFYGGVLDHVAVYTSVLSDARIRAHAEAAGITFETPEEVSGLAAWYDATKITGLADNDPVTSWPDASGNGHDLTAPTTAKQPTYKASAINAKAAVDFDGGDALRRVTGLTIPQPYTVFVVGLSRNAAGGVGNFTDGTAGTSSSTIRAVVGAMNSTNWRMWAGDTIATGAIRDTNPHVFHGEFDGATSALRVDGTQEASGDAGTQNWRLIVLGADRQFSAQHLDGQIAEVIVYNRKLTTTERGDVESYLATKWGITI